MCCLARQPRHFRGRTAHGLAGTFGSDIQHAQHSTTRAARLVNRTRRNSGWGTKNFKPASRATEPACRKDEASRRNEGSSGRKGRRRDRTVALRRSVERSSCDAFFRANQLAPVKAARASAGQAGMATRPQAEAKKTDNFAWHKRFNFLTNVCFIFSSPLPLASSLLATVIVSRRPHGASRRFFSPSCFVHAFQRRRHERFALLRRLPEPTCGARRERRSNRRARGAARCSGATPTPRLSSPKSALREGVTHQSGLQGFLVILAILLACLSGSHSVRFADKLHGVGAVERRHTLRGG